MYEQALETELARRVGLRFNVDERRAIREIQGIPRVVIGHFSKHRQRSPSGHRGKINILVAKLACQWLPRGSSTESFPLFGYDLRDYDTLYREKLDLGEACCCGDREPRHADLLAAAIALPMPQLAPLTSATAIRR